MNAGLLFFREFGLLCLVVVDVEHCMSCYFELYMYAFALSVVGMALQTPIVGMTLQARSTSWYDPRLG